MVSNPFQDGISVQISGDSSNLEAAAGNAQASMLSFKKSVGLVGGALAALSAGAMAAAVNSAQKFQSELVELEKVTNPETAQEMSGAIKEMAETIPLAQTELAQIASDAGRFGVRGPENIENFTRAVSKMSVATDLSADRAGEALAKLAELTDTPIEKVENLGSVINELSNNFATSSSEIVDSMLRSSAAMSQFGLTQTEIAGFSAALNAVSESSERAGTRLRRVVQEISNPKKIRDMAAALEMNVDQYRAMMENNPRKLLVQMAQAFREGGSTADALNKELSTTSRQALAGLGQNLDGLNRALGMSADAFEKNTSLQEEFQTASQTLSNQVQLLWNRLRNVAITIGMVLIPALTRLVEQISSGVARFQDFNEATNGVVATAALLTTLIGGLVAVFGAFGPAILSVINPMAALSGVVTTVVGAITGFASTLVGLGSTAVTTGTLLYSSIHATLLGLPTAIIGAATALGTMLVSSLVAVKTALLGLPAQIAAFAVQLGTTLVAAATSAVATLGALPGIIAAKTAAMVSSITVTGLLSGALGALSTAAGIATGGVTALTAALATIGAPIAIVIAAAAALYAAWKSNFLGIRDITSTVISLIKALFTGDFATVKNIVGNVATQARQFWDNNIRPMLATAREIIGKIQSSVIQPFLAWFVPIWRKHLGTIKQELAITAQAWLDAIAGFIEWARPYVSAFLADLSAWWSQHGDEVMSIVNPLLSGLKRLFEMAFSVIADIIIGFIRLARGDMSGFKSSMLSIIDTLVSGVVDLFQWLYNRLIGNSIIPNMLSDIIGAVRGFKSKALSAGKGLIDAFIQGIKNKTNAVGRAVDNTVQKARDKLPGSDAKEGPLSDLTDAGAALPETVAEGMESNLRALEGSSLAVAQAASPAMAGSSGSSQSVVINVDASGSKNPRAAERRARRGVASALNAHNVQR